MRKHSPPRKDGEPLPHASGYSRPSAAAGGLLRRSSPGPGTCSSHYRSARAKTPSAWSARHIREARRRICRAHNWTICCIPRDQSSTLGSAPSRRSARAEVQQPANSITACDGRGAIRVAATRQILTATHSSHPGRRGRRGGQVPAGRSRAVTVRGQRQVHARYIRQPRAAGSLGAVRARSPSDRRYTAAPRGPQRAEAGGRLPHPGQQDPGPHSGAPRSVTSTRTVLPPVLTATVTRSTGGARAAVPHTSRDKLPNKTAVSPHR